MLMGEFKQEVLRINNKANMEVFKQGLLSQRIDVFRNEVVITAKNRRVNVLAYDALDRQTTEMMDRALIVRHKKIFIQMMQDELGVKVLSHLKDYDPELEISASVSIFEKNIEDPPPDRLRRRQLSMWASTEFCTFCEGGRGWRSRQPIPAQKDGPYESCN